MSLLVDLSHQLGAFKLDAQFEAPAGITALFGPSGSGKTTIVNSVAGLMTPDNGRISLDGTDLFESSAGVNMAAHKRRVGYVFQDARLFPHLDVRANLTYGQRFARHCLPIEPVVEMLDLAHLVARKPATLSGGETQRVAIGRALLSDPAILLMDEPLAALDAARKENILPYLERLRDEARMPILYVSHAMSEVARLATTLVLIRDGQVTRQGPVEDILSDPNAVRDLGVQEAGAILNATVSSVEAGDGLSALKTSAGNLLLPKLQLPVGAAVRVRIQASDVILSKDRPDGLSALNILPAIVSSVHIGTGPGAAVALNSGQDKLLARITVRSAKALKLKPGIKCFAIIKSVSVAPADVGGGPQTENLMKD